MTHELQPLRLAVGSHQPGSGVGCAMNLLAWMHDPTNITDYPACTAKPLARIVQGLNDSICRGHNAGPLMLCPECSQTVLDVAFSVDGTGGADRMTHVRFAVWCARQIPHDNRWVLAAIEATEAWIANPTPANQRAVLPAGDAASRVARETSALDPLQLSAHAAASAARTATASFLWENSAREAASSAFIGSEGRRLYFTRRAIAAWHEIAGTTPTTPEPAAVEHAAQLMTVKS